MQSDMVTITLSRNDIGQLLDGLRERKNLYDNTVLYWHDELYDRDIAEVSSEHEAQSIADHYGEIIRQIEAQL
jgi:hypothetical protein